MGLLAGECRERGTWGWSGAAGSSLLRGRRFRTGGEVLLRPPGNGRAAMVPGRPVESRPRLALGGAVGSVGVWVKGADMQEPRSPRPPSPSHPRPSPTPGGRASPGRPELGRGRASWGRSAAASLPSPGPGPEPGGGPGPRPVNHRSACGFPALFPRPSGCLGRPAPLFSADSPGAKEFSQDLHTPLGVPSAVVTCSVRKLQREGNQLEASFPSGTPHDSVPRLPRLPRG